MPQHDRACLRRYGQSQRSVVLPNHSAASSRATQSQRGVIPRHPITAQRQLVLPNHSAASARATQSQRSVVPHYQSQRSVSSCYPITLQRHPALPNHSAASACATQSQRSVTLKCKYCVSGITSTHKVEKYPTATELKSSPTFIHSCETTDVAVVTNAGGSAVPYTHGTMIYGTHSRI